MENINRSRNSLHKGVLFLIFYFLFSYAGAQTFTERLQESKAGEPSVTVHESAEIDKLVNSEQLTARPAAASSAAHPAATPGHPAATSGKDAGKTQAANSAQTAAGAENPSAGTENGAAAERPRTVHGVKVMGYRVQAYVGGNSRKDRQQAEQVGNNIKAQFSGVPVYVHFYSPRWICRVGNYRTYEEAHQMLVSLRKLGYTQASIVKGKITVPY